MTKKVNKEKAEFFGSLVSVVDERVLKNVGIRNCLNFLGVMLQTKFNVYLHFFNFLESVFKIVCFFYIFANFKQTLKNPFVTHFC